MHRNRRRVAAATATLILAAGAGAGAGCGDRENSRGNGGGGAQTPGATVGTNPAVSAQTTPGKTSTSGSAIAPAAKGDGKGGLVTKP